MGGWLGGPCDFSVSPSPFGLDFGTLDLGLTIHLKLESIKLFIRVCTSIPQQECRTIPRQQCLTTSRWTFSTSWHALYNIQIFALGSSAPAFPGSSARLCPQVSGLRNAPTCVRVCRDKSACLCLSSNVYRWDCHLQHNDWWLMSCICHGARCRSWRWPVALCPSNSAQTCAPTCFGAR